MQSSDSLKKFFFGSEQGRAWLVFRSGCAGESLIAIRGVSYPVLSHHRSTEQLQFKLNKSNECRFALFSPLIPVASLICAKRETLV